MAEKFRITYATMSADNEELQAAYDAAAERAKAELGKTYPVDRERRGALARRDLRRALADRQGHPDREVLPGDHAGRRRRGRGRQGVPARVGPDGLEGARADPAQRRRHHGGAGLRPRRPDGLRGRQEPARGARRRAGDRRADPLELRRDGEARRVPHADERARRGGRLLRRAAAPRRVGRDQPVQLPDGAVGRAVQRRARRRQHGRAEAVEPGRAARLQALRVLPRRRRAAWRVPPRHGSRRGRGRPPVEAPRRERRHVHRFVPGRHGHLQALRRRTCPSR